MLKHFAGFNANLMCLPRSVFLAHREVAAPTTIEQWTIVPFANGSDCGAARQLLPAFQLEAIFLSCVFFCEFSSMKPIRAVTDFMALLLNSN